MKKTILVIDDFETSAFVLASTLKTHNYDVIKANSGAEALKKLNGQQIDLLITDYNMPNMNGLEFVRKFKALQEYKKTPIFILSTETGRDVKDRARKIGVTAWIKKPFRVDLLISLMQRIL